MKTPNIIIMDARENLIRWLDPDLCDVEETNAVNKCRKITITYPYENRVILEDEVQWYEQGNKIYIPSINGVTSCLYVINTDYEIDFWKENKVTVEAEEVLTELNYDVVSFKSGSVITITEEKLEEWFGSYYDIGVIDSLASNRKQISPEGVMTRMSLFRLIEEQTERTFITDYNVEEGNKIIRTLSLRDINTEDFDAQTETLDLNYNLESLEFTKSEEKTYNAIAPLISPNNAVTGEDVANLTSAELSSLIVRSAESKTSTNTMTQYPLSFSIPSDTVNMSNTDLNTLFAMYLNNTGTTGNDNVGGDTTGNTVSTPTTKTYDELLTEWLDYEVFAGQEVPMIIKQDDDGNTVVASTWYAPFSKNKGELYIYSEGESQASYNLVSSYDKTKSSNKLKIATMTTSEQLVQGIYNDLAVSLLTKLSPQFELKIDVKDIQVLLGLDNLGYQLHERLEVRVPNFNYFVPCRIVETTKNLHLPGENKIKVETDVTSILKLYGSRIESNDMIISSYDTNTPFGGVLYGGEDEQEALQNRTITVSIKLTKVYSATNEQIQQQIKKFDPYNNTYVFSDEEIQRLERALRNDAIKHNRQDEYRMRDINGNVYSVPQIWARAIHATRCQIYINNESVYGGFGKTGLGHGVFDETISVHYYPDNREKLAVYTTGTYETNKRYYPSRYIDIHNGQIAMFKRMGLNPYSIVLSHENQNGPTCVPAACSNISSYLYTYHTEYALAKLMNAEDNGTSFNNAQATMEILGFKCTPLEATAENIKRYLNLDGMILIAVNAGSLIAEYGDGRYQGINEFHALVLTDWYLQENNRVFVRIMDSNIPYLNPMLDKFYPYDDEGGTFWAFEMVRNATVSYYNGEKWGNVTSNLITTRHMMYIENTEKNLAKNTEIQGASIILSAFNPELKTYIFKINTVRTAIINSIKAHIKNGDTSTPMTLYTDVETTSKESYSLSMYWLRAISYAFMYSYMDTEDKTSNKDVTVNGTSNTMRYFEHFDTDTNSIGVYDWFTPCKISNDSLRNAYTIATLLFNLGFAYSCNDFVDSTGTFTGITTKIKEKTGTNINSWIIKNNSTEIKKYLNKDYYDNYHYTVMFAYATNSELHNHTSIRQTSYPVMLYSADGDTIYYQNIMGTGNNPELYYNTTVLDATNNPYGNTSIENMVTWINEASDEAPSGSANQILVLSWFTKNDLEAQ